MPRGSVPVGHWFNPGSGAANTFLFTPIVGLDFGDSNTYSGSGQTVFDIGSVGEDFFLGSSGSSEGNVDPTFNGTAGNKSSNEFFSPTGATTEAFFQSKTLSLAEFVALGHNSATWTMMFAANMTFNGFTLNTTTTFNYGGPGNSVSGVEVLIGFDPVGAPGTVGVCRVETYQDDGNTVSSSHTTTINVSSGWVITIVSFDEAAGAAASFVALNNTFETFDGTMTSPGSNSSTNLARLGMPLINSGGVPITPSWSMWGLWDFAMTQSQAQDQFTAVKDRFGL